MDEVINENSIARQKSSDPATMVLLLSPDSPVIQDLLQALNDEDLTDVTLEGHDCVPIPASRFVLASRSSVLKRMLYGNFREANSSRIFLEDYDSVILEAIVEYCYKNEISKFRLYIHRTAQSARRLVSLYKAADYLDLSGLARLVSQMAHNLTSRYPPLACAVFDEADLFTKVSRDALDMIQSRPYVTLPPDVQTEGGIGCLSSHKLISIYKDMGVQAGELFLFQMLQAWKECRQDEHEQDDCGGAGGSTSNIHATLEACASHLVLENIEPHDILTKVSPSGFCTAESITQAITKQALRASQTRVWLLSSRGPDIERILVEGAGSKEANGIYYRIDGLANGELYSKKEISCGQQYVYTLSISLLKGDNKATINEQVECRIFCSKILTHKASARLTKRSSQIIDRIDSGISRRVMGDPAFQPILQVIDIVLEDDIPNGNLTADKQQKIQLSDGEHFIYGIMTLRLHSASRKKEITENTLIKVTEYEKCIASSFQEINGVEPGQVYLRLNKFAIITQDPGHKFGNPVYFYDICDDESEITSFSSSSSLGSSQENPASIVNAHPSTAIGNQSSMDSFMIPRQLFVTESQALQELYYCNYQICDKPIDSKVPDSEWELGSDGIAPGPRCRWISAAAASNDVEQAGQPHQGRGGILASSTPRPLSRTFSIERPTVTSFNAFAASVLPLPLKSKYSISPPNIASKT